MMNRKWFVLCLVMLVALLALQPASGQPGPGYSDCEDDLLAQFQQWDDAFMVLLNRLPQSVAADRDALTGHLETGMAFGEAGCAEVRARYFERVARVYAMLSWTSAAALQAQDASAVTYLGDLTDKAARMTGWLRTLPARAPLSRE
jgi:hypothetical protein